ncbi:MAG: chemotaxis protein CheR [Rhodobacteraceae bacterium]|nr:chemotaxis protein CheR [Paracoccaceae bacterium]
MSHAPFLPIQPTGLRPDQAALICRIARQRGGLAIAPTKIAFLEQRLSRRLRVTGHAEFDHYLDDLLRPGAEGEVDALIEALTTHTTSFFRERRQFDWLCSEGLPALVALGAGRDWPFMGWSAACSSGAELWTLAMVLDRFFSTGRGGSRWQVAGSDLSRAILERAARAVYTEDEIAGLPEDYRKAYLMRSRRRHHMAPLFRIGPELRRHATFHHANLVKSPPPLAAPADVVFLRNVLIYFDDSGRDAALRHVMSPLRQGGLLFTGHTESLAPVPPSLVQVAPSTYRKV